MCELCTVRWECVWSAGVYNCTTVQYMCTLASPTADQSVRVRQTTNTKSFITTNPVMINSDWLSSVLLLPWQYCSEWHDPTQIPHQLMWSNLKLKLIKILIRRYGRGVRMTSRRCLQWPHLWHIIKNTFYILSSNPSHIKIIKSHITFMNTCSKVKLSKLRQSLLVF